MGWIRVSGLDVAPPMLVQPAPPLVLTCHWMVGAGLPFAVAENEALAP